MHNGRFPLSLKYLLLSLMLILPMAPRSFPKTLYRWVDKNGKVHVTDDRFKLPDGAKGIEAIEGERDPGGEVPDNAIDEKIPRRYLNEYSEEIPEDVEAAREEARRRFRESALKLRRREEEILSGIESLKVAVREKKKEVDYLLIYSYPADYEIRELKRLKGRLTKLQKRVPLIDREWGELRTQARKAGVPPGYLRP